MVFSIKQGQGTGSWSRRTEIIRDDSIRIDTQQAQKDLFDCETVYPQVALKMFFRPISTEFPSQKRCLQVTINAAH